ncbi:thioesterase II family protein [Streptomyces sp. NPDC059743]|uniref:thioesterase II family protein n=1 Tax=Streptomyces sp. NPDC059743 TaxID=3346928 RepID=UPI003655258C
MGATSQAILDNEEMLSLLLAMLRSDFALADRYRHTPGPVLSKPIVTLAGRDDPEVGPEVMADWARETQQPLRQLDLVAPICSSRRTRRRLSRWCGPCCAPNWHTKSAEPMGNEEGETLMTQAPCRTGDAMPVLWPTSPADSGRTS